MDRRLIPLAPRNQQHLAEITAKVRERGGVSVEPLQLTSLLLEKMTRRLSDEEAEELVRPRRRASR